MSFRARTCPPSTPFVDLGERREGHVVMLELTDIRYLRAGNDGKSGASDSELLAYCRNEWKVDDPAGVAARLSSGGKVARRRRRLVGWLVSVVRISPRPPRRCRVPSATHGPARKHDPSAEGVESNGWPGPESQQPAPDSSVHAVRARVRR
jgi:hypothetical protein